MDLRRWEGHRRLLIVKGFRHDQRCDRWGIGLKPRGVLAQREEWTRWGVVVLVEKVVNQVRRKRNKVDEEESRRERTDGLPSQWPPVIALPEVHGELNLAD